jgi:uncharacterized membrane protein YgcG
LLLPAFDHDLTSHQIQGATITNTPKMHNPLITSTGLLALSHLAAAHPAASTSEDTFIARAEPVGEMNAYEARDFAADEREQWTRTVRSNAVSNSDEDDATATTVDIPDEVNNEVVGGKKGGGSSNSGGSTSGGSSGGKPGRPGGGGGVVHSDDDEDAAPRSIPGLKALAALAGGWLLMAAAM